MSQETFLQRGAGQGRGHSHAASHHDDAGLSQLLLKMAERARTPVRPLAVGAEACKNSSSGRLLADQNSSTSTSSCQHACWLAAS